MNTESDAQGFKNEIREFASSFWKGRAILKK